MKQLGGRFAKYRGRLYRAHPAATFRQVLLVAHGDRQPEEGFESVRPGVWERLVPRAELNEHYDIERQCTYRDLDCIAARECDDGRIEILYWAGNSYAARKAGMTEVDRGIFQALVDPSELTDLHDVRRDL